MFITVRPANILTMHDIMFNTEMPSIAVPTTPITIPMLWKASGMAKNPPPIVAFTICISASLFLCDNFGAYVKYREKKKSENIRFLYYKYLESSHFHFHFHILSRATLNRNQCDDLCTVVFGAKSLLVTVFPSVCAECFARSPSDTQML